MTDIAVMEGNNRLPRTGATDQSRLYSESRLLDQIAKLETHVYTRN